MVPEGAEIALVAVNASSAAPDGALMVSSAGAIAPAVMANRRSSTLMGVASLIDRFSSQPEVLSRLGSRYFTLPHIAMN
jgi:hypothetical protein